MSVIDSAVAVPTLVFEVVATPTRSVSVVSKAMRVITKAPIKTTLVVLAGAAVITGLVYGVKKLRAVSEEVAEVVTSPKAHARADHAKVVEEAEAEAAVADPVAPKAAGKANAKK